jgi:hypothetical protein
MKYKRYYISRKKRGFTIIESLVYIFLTTMILLEGLNLYVLMYRYYIETIEITINYNNYQNFYITLDNIISEVGLSNVKVEDNHVIFSMINENITSTKIINSYNGQIVITYINQDAKKTINTLIKDIDNLEVKKKGNLIYFIIHDKDGKEFIRCI